MPYRWSEVDARRFLRESPLPRKPRRPQVPGYPCTAPVFLVLPYPPMNNRYYRHVQGRAVLSAEGRAYRRVVQQVVLTDWPRDVLRPFTNDLFLRLTLHPPSHRHRPDADAPLKATFDALTYAGVYVDDKVIHDYEYRRRGIRPPDGCIEVLIEPWCDDGT